MVQVVSYSHAITNILLSNCTNPNQDGNPKHECGVESHVGVTIRYQAAEGTLMDKPMFYGLATTA